MGDAEDNPGWQAAGPEEIARAVEILRAGGLVAFPTETVYGLGADALSPGAVGGVFRAKGRPAANPLIVHVSGEDMARRTAGAWPEAAHALARAFWPGPLTVVVPASPSLPRAVTAGGDTVGLRCPDHHVTLALLEAFGGPLVGPSANPSGRVSPTTSAHVRDGLPGVFVLEGGPCRGGIESTVVAVTGARPRILRPGLIGAEEISIVVGQPVEDGPCDLAPGAPLQSPGLLGAHYAPAASVALIAPADLRHLLGAHAHVALLSHSGLVARAPHATVPMPAEPVAYAARLYAALREADALRPSLIAVERPPTDGPVWGAITDRLARAATPPTP